MPVKELFTTTEAATMLGLSRATLMKLIESGEIGHVKVGTHHRVPPRTSWSSSARVAPRAGSRGAGVVLQRDRPRRLTILVVLADANILFSGALRDYVTYAADEGAIGVRGREAVGLHVSRAIDYCFTSCARI